MTQTMYLNQFAQTPIKGNSATKVNLNTLPVSVDPNSVNTLLPGDAVYLTTTTANQIYVDKWSVGQGQPFGYVLYNMRIDQFLKNDRMEIGLAGTIMFAEAGATISRGNQLEYVPNATATGPQMIPSAGINPVSAVALDNAASAGIFRMMVLFQPEVAQSATYILPTVAFANSVNPLLGLVQFVSATVSSLTFNATTVLAGKFLTFIINNAQASGTVAIAFNTNFRANGTLPTSLTQNKICTIMFVGDGTTWDEVSRTGEGIIPTTVAGL